MSMQASKGGDNWLVGICRLVGCLIDLLVVRYFALAEEESIIR